MNSTTWKIEPNILVWGLLIVATLALCLIAIGIMRCSFSKHVESSAPQSIRLAHSSTYRTCTTFSIIACVLALIAISGTFFNVNPTDVSTPINILGTFIAALLGWQVFNAIENVKTLKQIDRLKGKLEIQQQEMKTRTAMLTNRMEAMDMLGFLRNADNTLNDRYFNGVRAVDLFLDSGIPDNFIYLNETLTELSNLLTILEQRSPNLEAGVIADTEETLERLLRSITRKIDETSDYLSQVQDRITILSRRRRRVCDLAREARLNIAERVSETKGNPNGN